MIFYIVDVFAEQKYAGNQLAVVRGAWGLPDEALQDIASEMNYSETAFVLSEEGSDGYDVRIFTPAHEVPFAGHPTLGTAFVIKEEILREPVRRLVLNLEAGRIPVEFGEVLWMRQLPPTLGERLDPARVAPILGLAERDLDARYPVQKVSTGLPAIVVPLEDLDALRRCRFDQARYRELTDARENVYAFCPEAHDGDAGHLSARMFAEDLGVPEDAATGSAAGCLAAYLVEHRYLGDGPVDVRVEQGYEIGRPSLLYLRAQRKGAETEVRVGGKVQMVAWGELL